MIRFRVVDGELCRVYGVFMGEHIWMMGVDKKLEAPVTSSCFGFSASGCGYGIQNLGLPSNQ